VARTRELSAEELTPDARIDRAKRLIAEAIAEMVSAMIAKGVSGSEWVDQTSSPLGRQRHLRLVRKGILKAARDGRRVLVRRADHDAYLESTRRISVPDDANEDAIWEALCKGSEINEKRGKK